MIEWEELEIEIEYDSEAEELTERATSRDLRYLIHVIFEIKTIEDNR